MLALGDHVGGGQPGGGRVGLGQLDVDRGRVVERALVPGGVDRRGDPPRVAGQVVGVAQRDLEPGHRLPFLAA